MSDVTAKRTLVKSPPELWSELSDAEALGKHLEAFGEIRISKLDPETSVAWEGDRASGTASIEQSGWGTAVTLTASVPASGEPEDHVESAETDGRGPEAAPPSPGRQRDGFFARLFPGFWLEESAESPEPAAAEPTSDAPPVEEARAVLDQALDSLGSAHHRPFSRA